MASVPVPNLFFVLDNVGEKPNTAPSATYNGQVITNGYTVPEGVNVTGYESGTNAGTYVAVYTPDDDHEWADGTQDAVTVTLTVNALDISAAAVTLGSGKTYNGQAQTQGVASVVINGLSATFNVSGNVQTNAGSYTLTCTGTGNFTGTKSVSWSIARAAGYVNLSASSFEFDQNKSAGFTFSASGSVSVSYQSGCTVSLSGSSGTVSSGTIGTGSFTIYAAASQNYNAAAASASVNVLNPYFYMRVKRYNDANLWAEYYVKNGNTFLQQFGRNSYTTPNRSNSGWTYMRRLNVDSYGTVRVEIYDAEEPSVSWSSLCINGAAGTEQTENSVINRYATYTHGHY